jgi:hypothetical protein
MLDQLPTELLLPTLELAAPLDYSPSFDLERRELLRNCCLVSKRVCAMAQPMLVEVYCVSSAEDVQILQAGEGINNKGSVVKLLILAHEYSASLYEVSAALRLCPNIVELRMLDVPDFDFDWLEGNLGTLVLLLLHKYTLLTKMIKQQLFIP